MRRGGSSTSAAAVAQNQEQPQQLQLQQQQQSEGHEGHEGGRRFNKVGLLKGCFHFHFVFDFFAPPLCSFYVTRLNFHCFILIRLCGYSGLALKAAHPHPKATQPRAQKNFLLFRDRRSRADRGQWVVTILLVSVWWQHTHHHHYYYFLVDILIFTIFIFLFLPPYHHRPHYLLSPPSIFIRPALSSPPSTSPTSGLDPLPVGRRWTRQ